MKRYAAVFIFFFYLALSLSPFKTTEATVQQKPFVVEYYYKAKWGYADEFMTLFKKNHLPV